MTDLYYERPARILEGNNWLYFFPTFHYSVEQNVNALLLFVLYVGVVVAVTKRHPKYLIYAFTIMVVLALLHKSYTFHQNGLGNRRTPAFPELQTRRIDSCQPKNPSVFDMRGNVHRPPVCEDPVFARSRSFYPVSDPSMSDQTSFASWLSDGVKGCKMDPMACTGYN